jgi:hypothetical protein
MAVAVAAAAAAVPFAGASAGAGAEAAQPATPSEPKSAAISKTRRMLKDFDMFLTDSPGSRPKPRTVRELAKLLLGFIMTRASFPFVCWEW